MFNSNFEEIVLFSVIFYSTYYFYNFKFLLLKKVWISVILSIYSWLLIRLIINSIFNILLINLKIKKIITLAHLD